MGKIVFNLPFTDEQLRRSKMIIHDKDYTKKTLYNNELTSAEKIVVLCFLAHNDYDLAKEITLSNSELAELVCCSERAITDYIKSLVDKGYIEIVRFDGRLRHIKLLKV